MHELPVLESNFPITYREDVCVPIFENIKNGESFSFIGMEDNCKVNVLRFIVYRSDVQKKYLGKEAGKYLFIFIDLNELPEASLISFYHLIGSCLVETLQQQDLKFSYLNNLFIDNPVILLKALKEDIAHIAEETGKSIIFLFNNFDQLKKLDLEIIANNLTALRNASRYRVAYVFTALRPFPLKRFFFQKIIWMKPFASDDAAGVVERNMKRYHVVLKPKQIIEVIQFSGGHGGMIKFIIQALSRYGLTFLKEKELNTNSDICFQCERLIAPLTDIEKAKLKTGEKDQFLINLGMQAEQRGLFIPFSPLLAGHLRENVNCLSPFCYDKENDEIYFWGKPIVSNLTLKETLLLRMMIETPEKIFSRQEIMGRVWGEDEFPSDWALDKLISRLRLKIGDNPLQSRYFRSIRGKGITLQ